MTQKNPLVANLALLSCVLFSFSRCKTGEGHFQFLTQQGREILECVKLQTQRLASLRHLQQERQRRPSLDSVPCTRSSENETVDSLTSTSFSWKVPRLCDFSFTLSYRSSLLSFNISSLMCCSFFHSLIFPFHLWRSFFRHHPQKGTKRDRSEIWKLSHCVHRT